MIRSLDPVPLNVLAGFMADEVWLDMAVCELGILNRVRIETIHIHRTREDLTVCQEWCQSAPEDLTVNRHTFGQDRVRWCHRTEVGDIREVHPPNWTPPPRTFATVHEQDRLWEAVADTAEFLFGVKRGVFTARNGRGKPPEVSDARNSAMVAMYEWTPLSQEKVAARWFDGRSAPCISQALNRRRGQMEPFRKLVAQRIGSLPPRTFA